MGTIQGRICQTLTVVLLCTSLSQAQNLGGFAHVGTESFYTKNFLFVGGLRYKEIRIGYTYQSAQSEEGQFTRKGLYAEVGLCNVEEIVYLSAGARVLSTNKEFVEFVPHASIQFRIKKYVEIPIVLSSYSNWLVGSFGVRLLL